MIEIDIPGSGALKLEHLVLDYNGTLALDGALLQGVAPRLQALADSLQIHVVTADTFGRAHEGLRGLPCNLVVLPAASQDVAKQRFVRELGPSSTVAIGNGLNDALMLEEAALGIAVILEEGATVRTLMAADVACLSITAALDLLTHPRRLVATLRR
ncbi:MAG: ATPase P [Planctomycetota bacterium]